MRAVTIIALLFQIASGVMLFAPEASHIGMNPVFRVKVIAILLGLANVALLEVLVRRPNGDRVSAGVRTTAVASLGIWLAVAALGRLIAYF